MPTSSLPWERNHIAYVLLLLLIKVQWLWVSTHIICNKQPWFDGMKLENKLKNKFIFFIVFGHNKKKSSSLPVVSLPQNLPCNQFYQAVLHSTFLWHHYVLIHMGFKCKIQSFSF